MELLSGKDENGQTWAHKAIYLCRDADEVTAALDGLNTEERTNLLSIKDDEGQTWAHKVYYLCRDADEVRAAFDGLNSEQRTNLLSIKDNYGKTPIHSAASSCNNADVLRAMLETLDTDQRICLLSVKDDAGWTLLHWATSHYKNAQVVRALLETLETDQRLRLLSIRNNTEWTPIHSAAVLCKNADVVRAFFETLHTDQKSALLFDTDNMQKTPLSIAFDRKRDWQVVGALLENLDRVTLTKNVRGRPLIYDVVDENTDHVVLRSILESVQAQQRVDLLMTKEQAQQYILIHHIVRSVTNPEMVKVWLETLDSQQLMHILSVKDSTGSTALHHAVQFNGYAQNIIKALLETLNRDKRKSLLLRKDKNKQTPIHIVARYGANPDLLRVLLKTLDLENIAEVLNASDSDGNTSIHIAVERRTDVDRENACAQLEQLNGLGKSALLLKKRKDGKSPIDLGDEHFYRMWLKDSEISYKAKVEILSKRLTSGQMMIHYLRDKYPSLLTTLTPTMPKTTLVAMLIAFKSGDASRDLRWINLLTDCRDDLGEESISHICCYMEEKLKGGEASGCLGKLLDIICEALDCRHRVLCWEDTNSNTLLHAAAMINHKEFIKKMLMTQETDEYHSALLRRNKDGKSPYYLTNSQEVQKLLAWTETQKGCYPLVTPPRIVIFYSDVDRPGSDGEMDSLLNILPEFNVKVTLIKNATKEELFTQIREHQNGEVSALMVVIMCNGYSGVVQLHDGDLPIRAVLNQMNPQTLEGIPKILFLQACQGPPESSRQDNPVYDRFKDAAASDMNRDATIGNRTIERPTDIRAPDMMVLAATVNKQKATRNLMIPLLAKNLMESGVEDNLYDVFLTTANQVRKSEPTQVPFFQSTMTSKVCLKKVFRPDNNYASKAPQNTCTIS